jgi:pyridoxal phosphate enzyme (YggS family)
VIQDRVAAVRDRIARAARRAGRAADEVTLVAVSKTHPAEAVREAFAAGLRHFGENKVQEAEGKLGALGDLHDQGARWHLVGHLQTNKVGKAAGLFDTVHSVDSLRVAERLERSAGDLRRTLEVMVQVDLAGEETKSGVPPHQVDPLLEQLRGFKALRPVGLMTLPPLADDPEVVRPLFRRLREMRDDLRARNLLVDGRLSMGMSHDLEVAVEEGATHVRVGTAIFGERRAGIGGGQG